MKWSVTHIADGTKREVRKFAWFPVRVGTPHPNKSTSSEYIWLMRYTNHEEYQRIYTWDGWVTVRVEL